MVFAAAVGGIYTHRRSAAIPSPLNLLNLLNLLNPLAFGNTISIPQCLHIKNRAAARFLLFLSYSSCFVGFQFGIPDG